MKICIITPSDQEIVKLDMPQPPRIGETVLVGNGSGGKVPYKVEKVQYVVDKDSERVAQANVFVNGCADSEAC